MLENQSQNLDSRIILKTFTHADKLGSDLTHSIQLDSPIWFDTINLGWLIVHT